MTISEYGGCCCAVLAYLLISISAHAAWLPPPKDSKVSSDLLALAFICRSTKLRRCQRWRRSHRYCRIRRSTSPRGRFTRARRQEGHCVRTHGCRHPADDLDLRTQQAFLLTARASSIQATPGRRRDQPGGRGNALRYLPHGIRRGSHGCHGRHLVR